MNLKILSIRIIDGKKIEYNYSIDDGIKKYFNLNDPFYVEYDVDISNVPESILVIPFLANIAPIAWFAGFDIIADVVDETFYTSLHTIKNVFLENYPSIKNLTSNLKAKKLERKSYTNNSIALLFSGGVDAYTTYLRHYSKKPDLITIHGADVELKDELQWNRVIEINRSETLLDDNRKLYLKSNLRTFYNHNVDLLLPELGWWGKIQHGLALNGIIAPLSIVRYYSYVYIASSYTDNVSIKWGSAPEIDNNIAWGSTKVVHDGYEMKRQEKVDYIINTTHKLNKTINLRVCYSTSNTSINCCKCEKCYRTIIGIILANENPNKYGFAVTENVYDKILTMFSKGFSSQGMQYFWWEILQKIETENAFFVFKDEEIELNKMNGIKLLIKKNINNGIIEKTKWSIIKYKVQNMFPELFNFYLKVRTR